MNATALEQIELQLTAFETAFGNGSDAGMRAAIRRLSDLAGAKGPMAMASVMRIHGRIPEEESGRTFFWLGDAARRATEQGKPELPPRIFYLANFFKDLESNLGIADFDDMHVDRVPNRAMAKIAAEALVALQQLGPEAERVVVELGQVPVEAWTVGQMAAERVVALRHQVDDLPAEAVDLATALVAGPGSEANQSGPENG